MTTTTLPKLDVKTLVMHAATVKPQDVPVVCLQEQFTGPIPARRERPMAEILAERLVEADPSRPVPVFVP